MITLNLHLNDLRHFPSLPEPYWKQNRLTNNHNIDNYYDPQSPIDNLNDTLLELIFIRLSPWKHLAFCKCVSKRWNSILNNPDFLRHLTLFNFPFTLFLRRRDTVCIISEHPYLQKHKFRLDFLPNYHNNRSINIVAHNNDLLVSYHQLDMEQAAYYIANPLTKQLIVVPITNAEANCNLRNWSSIHVVGFAGAVDDNLGFRIVRITNEEQKIFVAIYSSQSRQWKTYPFDYLVLCFYAMRFKQALTFKKKLHWHGVSQILLIDPFRDDNVTPCFLGLPETIQEHSVLGVCRNRIQIAQLESNIDTREDPRIRIWEFKDDYDDFTTLSSYKMAELKLVIDFTLKKCFIDTALTFIDSIYISYRRRNSFNYSQHQLICCHPNDPDVIYLMYYDIMLRCNVARKRLKVIGCYKSSGCDYLWEERFVFLHPLTVGLSPDET